MVSAPGRWVRNPSVFSVENADLVEISQSLDSDRLTNIGIRVRETVCIPSAEDASQRCALRAEADLLAALEEWGIEHLDVDDVRTFVLYHEAVLDLRVDEGTLSAQAVTVTSQGFAHWVKDPDPAGVIADFCTGLVAASDTDGQ